MLIDRAAYDPNWEQRWKWCESRLNELSPVDDREQRRIALEALHLAHDAQFPTVAALAECRFKFYRSYAQLYGFAIAFPPLPEGATDDYVRDMGKAASDRIDKASQLAKRSALKQPEGLLAFGEEVRPGWQRSVHTITVDQSKLGPFCYFTIKPQQWIVLVERRGRCADVCLIRPDHGLGPDWNMEHVATAAFRELLASRSGFFWRGCSPHKVQFYVYVPFGQFDTLTNEYFCQRPFAWKNGRFHQPRTGTDGWINYASVPPVIAAFDPKPRSDLYVVPLPEQL